MEGASASDLLFDTRLVDIHEGLPVQSVSNRSLDRISETLGGGQNWIRARDDQAAA